MGVFFSWYQQVGFDETKKPWTKRGTDQGIKREVPQPFMSVSRAEWMPIIWEQNKNRDLATLINEGIRQGKIDKKYFINSKNEMAAEPSGLSNLFGGGGTSDGKTSSGYTIPLIVGGAALVAFLIFKKKS